MAVDPIQLFEHLDWSTLPAWMSYAEARRGPLSLFNDIIYANVTGSGGVSRSVRGGEATATFGANVKADYTLAIIEAGGAYAIWSRGRQGSAGATAFDVLAGARYWHQEVDVSADLTGTLDRSGLAISGNRAIASSGSVDWVDPFVGARLRHQLAPGEEIVVRGDVGGFGVGSQFTWQESPRTIGSSVWPTAYRSMATPDFVPCRRIFRRVRHLQVRLRQHHVRAGAGRNHEVLT